MKKVKETIALVGVGAVIALSLFAAWGWLQNIVAIVNTIDAPITGMFVLRCIGAFFAPLGAVLGFM